MKIYQLRQTQAFPITIEKAWEFFSNPRNLPLITPPEMRIEFISDLPEKMYAGELIIYLVRPILGLPITWVTEITQWNEGTSFVDEQLIGPYKLWHHQHDFRIIPGGVEMTDTVDYALPFGLLGRIAHSMIVKKKLDYIFKFRREYLEKRFGKMA